MNYNENQYRFSDILLALLSGVLLVLGFPPFDFYPLAWIALIPLLIAIFEKNGKTAFVLGTLTGFVYFIGTVYWVFNSMYYYGNVPAVVSGFMLVLLCSYLALYVGTFSMFFSVLSRRSILPSLLLVPVLWVSLEFFRTYALTGFPWSLLGYSQYRLLPLIQIADITGIYGVSFIVAALNGAIFDVAVYWPKKSGEMPLFARWPMTLSLLVYIIFIAVAVFYGQTKLEEDSKGRKIKVAVVQGNIEQDKKWDAAFQREVVDTYKRLSVEAAAESPDLIVWPETALPFVLGYNDVLAKEIKDFQKGLGSHLLTGSMVAKKSAPDSRKLSNSAVLLSPEGEVVSMYDKIHLVPYGEYVPLRRVMPFVDKLTVAIGDFIPGKETSVMETPFARIGNLICYEIIFPGLVRKFVNNGANVLITITNDAWFGRTAAPYQLFSMAVFRAVENRVPVVRSANTGISGFIDSRGRIIDKSDIFVEAVLTEDIYPGDKKSFYARNGDVFASFCIAVFLLLVILNKSEVLRDVLSD